MSVPTPTDRCVGQLLHLPLPPHHNPTPSLPRSDSVSSAVSFESANSAAPSSPAVPRSSSFTRSRRFLTGDGLSAREALGLLDFDDDVSATGDPELDAAILHRRFEYARESIRHLFLVPVSFGVDGKLVRPPPPPPPMAIPQHLAPVGKVFLHDLPDVSSLNTTCQNHTRYPPNFKRDEYADIDYDEDERWQDPADNGNDEPRSSEDPLPKPARSTPRPTCPRKGAPRSPPPLSPRLQADALHFSTGGGSPLAQANTASNPPSDSSSEPTEPRSLMTSLQQNDNALVASNLLDRPESRLARTSKSVQGLVEKPHFEEPVENTSCLDGPEVFNRNTETPRLIDVGEMARRRSHIRSSPNNRRRSSSSGRSPVVGDHYPDSDRSGMNALCPPRSKTFELLRSMFNGHGGPPEKFTTNSKGSMHSDNNTIGGAVVSKNSTVESTKSRISASGDLGARLPAMCRPQGPDIPSSALQHDSEFTDVADTVVEEHSVALTSLPAHDRSLRRKTDSEHTAVEKAHSEAGPKQFRNIRNSSSSLQREAGGSRPDTTTPSDTMLSESLRERLGNDVSDDGRLVSAKEIARKRMDLFQRFKAIQDNVKFELQPHVNRESPEIASPSATQAHLKPADDRMTPSFSSAQSSNHPLRGIRCSDPVHSNDDNVSFMSANDDCVSPTLASSITRTPRSDKSINKTNAKSSFPNSPHPSPTVESVINSAPSQSKSDRFCAHPGIGSGCSGVGCLDEYGCDIGRVQDPAILPTSKDLSHFGLPHTLTGSVPGVNAHSFLDGPVVTPLRDIAVSPGDFPRSDSHKAFIQEIDGDRRPSDSLLKDSARLGTAEDREIPPPAKRKSEMKKTVSGLRGRLAQAKDASAGLVARAKKIPRGASFSRLRSGVNSPGVDSGRRRSRSMNAGVDETKPLMSAMRFTEEPSEDGSISVANESPLENKSNHPPLTRSAPSAVTSKVAPVLVRKVPLESASNSQRSTPIKELVSDPRQANSTTKKASPVNASDTPDFVTIQRVIKRVNKDGTEEVIRKRVRVKPESVLPNGDVVVRRTVQRMKDDGSGMEVLTVMQVIPRRKGKESKLNPFNEKKAENELSTGRAVPESAVKITKSLETSDDSLRATPAVGTDTHDDPQIIVSARASSLPSIRSGSLALCQKPVPDEIDGILSERRASLESAAGRGSAAAPFEHGENVVVRLPRGVAADMNTGSASGIGTAKKSKQDNPFRRVRSGKVGRAKSGSRHDDREERGTVLREDGRGGRWPWTLGVRREKAGRGVPFQGREEGKREGLFGGLWKKSS